MSENKRKFFLEFFRHNSKVGSITPSSRFLAKKMLEDISFKDDIVIAEFGPGTGVFTKEIIRRMTPNSKLYVFELNNEFLDILKEKITTSKQVNYINDSAGNIQQHLAKDGIEKVDYIVSSLPLSLFDEDIREEIIQNSYKSLKNNGIMTQFQYSEQCKSLFEDTFQQLKVKFTVLNIPPAFVYVCQKKED